MLVEMLKAHSGCGEKGVGTIHALIPIPLEWHKAWSQQVMVTFTETIMLSLLLCLLWKIHGYLSGDPCCFITSFPMLKRAEKLAVRGTKPRLQHGNQARKQATV